MKLHLGRALRGHDMEIGLLYIDRRPECLVEMLGSYAIVSDRYRIEIRTGPGFDRPLPVLLDRHGVERLRFVPGGTLCEWRPGHLVPALENPGGGIRRTREAFDSVFAQIQAAFALGEDVRIRVV